MFWCVQLWYKKNLSSRIIIVSEDARPTMTYEISTYSWIANNYPFSTTYRGVSIVPLEILVVIILCIIKQQMNMEMQDILNQVS